MNYVELIKGMNFFKGFQNNEIALVAEICSEEYYPRHSIIFKENTQADSFYLIINGQVKISHYLDKIGEEELVVLDNGECFGEMALIDGEPRSASAVAEVDTRLLVIKNDSFEQLINKDNRLAIKILNRFCRILSMRLRDANRQISDITGLCLSFRTRNAP